MRAIHPLAEAIPRMTPEEYEDLKADIKERGLLHRIVLFEDLILDGRHRWEACADLGITPLTITYDGDDPVGYVLSSNLMRRHLTREQIRTAAGFLHEEQKKRVGENQHSKEGASNDAPSKTAEKIAKQTGLSARTVERAAKQVREIKQADPELAEEVKAGKTTLAKAGRTVKERKADASKEFDDYLQGRLDPEVAAQVLTPDSRRPRNNITANDWADGVVNEVSEAVGRLSELPPVLAQAVARSGDIKRWIKTLRSTSEALNQYLRSMEA